MFQFLKNSYPTRTEIKKALKHFLEQIKHLEKNRYETRAFAYLDIISWVESKVYEKTMSEIIYGKYVKSKRK